MTASQFDVLVIGAGQAGPPLATSLAAKGKRVALAERKDIGGSCVNFGCAPTKAAIASARVAHRARRAGEYGVRIAAVEVDYPAVIDRARNMAVSFRGNLASRLGKTDNLSVIPAHARFEGRDADGIKVVIDAATDRLLGAAVLAREGAELVHIYIDLMNAGAPFQVIRDAVFIHPTLAEAIQSAVSTVAERPQTVEAMAHG